MNKKMVIVVVLLIVMASCAAAPQDQGNTPRNLAENDTSPVIDAEGPGKGNPGNSEDREVEDISDPEVEGLLFMREEEKLARDVYLELAEIWGQNIFSNIASSESAHMDAVLGLIIAVGEDDPAEFLDAGEFNNQELQDLYDDLITQGSKSLDQAYLVGGAIEEIDILDLQEFMSETDDPEIRRVYQNLLKGSINHLNAYVRSYERQTGEVYQPQFLTMDEYYQLLQENTGRGDGMSQGRGTGNGRQNN